MRIHSYVLDHDYGFAPNPFHGFCTLATCKPKIRQVAEVGDYVIGTGCAKRHRTGYLIYYMVIEEIITYDEYWGDTRFQRKRPNLRGSKMQAFGDNIYHLDLGTGLWVQENSFHSLKDGSINNINLQDDTKSINVLVASDFAYWGGSGPLIPSAFRNFQGYDICAKRGHKNRFPDALVQAYTKWLYSFQATGCLGDPLDWIRSD
ncbi:hypothetical protein CCAX7_11390 [Capsulimonas corticalis]|uniref:Uncharacterized protein n=1 Tax=Capsulimonas corticalis TaxID=2219043 RepID=A0A402CUS1_9BACT|nr:hypothetical protein [Capsulimonas corticalis]BDI29088.1 hypothetical protein CCAX7_11390 [Capsulimonas corticalis]